MSMAVILGLIVSLTLFLRASLTSARVGAWDLEQADIKTRVWEAVGALKFISLARAGPGRNDGPKHSQWMDWEKGRETIKLGSRAEETLGESKGDNPRGSQGTGRSRKNPGVVPLLEPAWYQPTIRMNMATR